MSDPTTPEVPDNRRPLPLAESLPEDDDLAAGLPSGSASRSPAMRQSAQPPRGPLPRSPQAPEVEAALKQANLLRVRGDLQRAEQEVRRALEFDPASGAVHEMLGDLLAQSGKTEQALISYRRAQSCGAGAMVEAKIGRMIVANRSDIAALRETPLTRGSGAIGWIASVLIPGLGVALAGNMRAALIAFLGWAVTLGLIVAIPATHSALESLTGRQAITTQPSPGAQFLLLFLCLANLGFYIYSLIETSRVSKPAQKDGPDD